MSEEVPLEKFNCSVTHTPYNVSVMKPFIPFNGTRRGQNFNAKQTWKGAIQGIKALNRLKGTLGTKLRPDLVLISGHEHGYMQVRNVDTGLVQRSAVHYNNVKVNNIVVTNSYVYTTTEKDLLKGKQGDDSMIYVWDLNKMTIVERLEEHEERVTCLAVCEVDQHICVSGSMDKSIIVWDIRLKNKVIAKLGGHTMMVTKVLVVDNIIYSGSADSTIRVWNTSGVALATFEGHSGPLIVMVWSLHPLDRKTNEATPAVLMTACGGGTVKEWTVQPNGLLKMRWTAKPHTGVITDLVEDGHLVITSGSDGLLNFYNRKTTQNIRISRPETSSMRCLEIDFSRKYVLSGTDQGQIMLWDYSLLFAGSTKDEEVHLLITLVPHTSAITSLLLERDNKGKWERVLSASVDNTIFTLDFMTDRDSVTFPFTSKLIVQLPVTGSVVTDLNNGQAVLWDLQRQCVKDQSKDMLKGHTAPLSGLEYAPELSRLITSSEDGTLRTWDISHFDEADMKNDELIRAGEEITVGFPVKTMSNPSEDSIAVGGAKGTVMGSKGVISVLDVSGGGMPATQFATPFVPAHLALPLPDMLLVQHRAGEVLSFSLEGVPLPYKVTVDADGTQGPLNYPAFQWNVDTNWDPVHVTVVVAHDKILRSYDLTGDHAMWTTVASSTITHVGCLRQAQMEAVFSTDKGETIVIDKQGKPIFEICHDGNTVNVQQQGISSGLSKPRRRSFVDVSQVAKYSTPKPTVTTLLAEREARLVAIGYSDGVVQLWETVTKRVVRRFHVGSAPTSIRVYSRQGRIVTCLKDKVRIDTLYTRTDQQKE